MKPAIFFSFTGKYNKFLSGELANVKDFIKKDLLGGLQSVVNQVEGLIPLAGAVNQVFENYYQALFEVSAAAVDGLSEIIEATGQFAYNHRSRLLNKVLTVR